MSAAVDVAVVGGGIVGLSVAFELADLQVGHVAVFERGQVGSGSTAKATGGIRTQFSTRANVYLAQRSRDRFLHWADVYGGDPRFRQVGYLFVTADPAQAEVLRSGALRQQGWGVRVDVVTGHALQSICPPLRSDDLICGTYTAEDGLADPGAAVNALAAACRRRGVVIHEGQGVRMLATTGDGLVTGIETENGDTIAAGTVIVCAGAWTAPLLAPLGYRVPIEPHHRQVYRTAPLSGWPPDMPLTVDFDTGIYCHSDAGAVVFGGGDRDTPPGYDDTPRPSDVAQLADALMHRWPPLANASVTHTWAGLREMTPDDHGIVGAVPGRPGLFVAAGFSGHGFMQAPAVGEWLAHLVAGRPWPMVDGEALGPGRFGGRVSAERYVF
jgi:sarcosine oxidase subunit beta